MNEPALGRFRATNALIVINVIVFLWVAATGGGFGYLVGTAITNETLLSHGALFGPAVAEGEWWRVISSAFLHAGIVHIGLNMFALYQIGTFVELMLGTRRMLALYFISMIGSGISVVIFSFDQITVGASGAIFGIFGALVAIGLRLGARGRGLVMQTLPILILNLVWTFAVPGISVAGHLGGLLTGFVAALLLARFPLQPQMVETETTEDEAPFEPVAGHEEEEAYLEHEGRSEP